MSALYTATATRTAVVTARKGHARLPIDVTLNIIRFLPPSTLLGMVRDLPELEALLGGWSWRWIARSLGGPETLPQALYPSWKGFCLEYVWPARRGRMTPGIAGYCKFCHRTPEQAQAVWLADTRVVPRGWLMQLDSSSLFLGQDGRVWGHPRGEEEILSFSPCRLACVECSVGFKEAAEGFVGRECGACGSVKASAIRVSAEGIPSAHPTPCQECAFSPTRPAIIGEMATTPCVLTTVDRVQG